ncbi:MAG TPA: sugar ABC transporter permease [Lachnospiraceae bacterium]
MKIYIVSPKHEGMKHMNGKKIKVFYKKSDTKTAWIMLAPAVIVLLLMQGYPILRTFYLSFHEMNLKKPGTGYPWNGLENYIQIFQDARVYTDLAFTVKFTIITVSLELIIGFAAALIMNREFKGRGIVRAAILVPWAIPTSVSAMMWKFIYNDQYGMFNDLLYKLGIIDGYKAWLSTSGGSFLALVVTDVWKTAPYMALLILSGLQMISGDLYESAKIDGANIVQRFLRITLPMVKKPLLVALLLRTLDAFRVFDLVNVLTGGANKTESIALYAYKQLMTFLNFGYGSALAIFIFLIVFAISGGYIFFINKDIDV